MHIDENELKKFQNGTLSTTDMLAFLEHLDNCEFCLNQIIQQEEKPDATAPVYLKEQILSKASSPEVQAAKKAGETSRKMQMFYYTLRTAAGVIAALFLLFSVGSIDFSSPRSGQAIEAMQDQVPQSSRRGNHLYDFTREIGQGITTNTSSVVTHLNEFSNKILNGGK